MRLWSLHPKYLDRMGLLAVWREANLAQSVLLKGEYTKCSKCEGNGTWNPKPNYKYFEICKKCKGTGKIKTPYYNHPQLERFKNSFESIANINLYLCTIYEEAETRDYKFKIDKIGFGYMTYYKSKLFKPQLTVTKEQLEYEYAHLQKKLKKRDYEKFKDNVKWIACDQDGYKEIEPHPLFKVINGEIESWEKITKA